MQVKQLSNGFNQNTPSSVPNKRTKKSITSTSSKFDSNLKNILKASDAEQEAVINAALLCLDNRTKQADNILLNPLNLQSYLHLQLANEENEIFGVIFLARGFGLISFEKLFYGTIDSVSVYPRVIAKKALELNASSVILFHNHPSGIAEPSRDDLEITKLVKTTLKVLDVYLHDHFIIAGREILSFAEKDLL